MDLTLAKTFVEVVRSGSMVKAAERLHLTQTAVTARIKQLEAELGCQLLIRNRAGARLTKEGETFLPHAHHLLSSWHYAKNSVALPDGHSTRICIGSETSLWNPLLINWTGWIRTHLPGVVVDVSVAEPAKVMESLEKGRLDAALIHTPNYYSGHHVEQLLEEKLIKVRNPRQDEPEFYTDWGDQFERQYSLTAPPRSERPLTFDLGPAALQYLLQFGGTGWIRTRVVLSYLESGVLERVAGTPEITYPVFLVSRHLADDAPLQPALAGLRDIALHDIPWDL